MKALLTSLVITTIVARNKTSQLAADYGQSNQRCRPTVQRPRADHTICAHAALGKKKPREATRRRTNPTTERIEMESWMIYGCR
eukprot:scaffold67055_cov16-Prasinocladus_malaysianus.AAC.2